MSSKKDLAARGLDVAARSIDLLAVLGELSNQASPMYQMALEFGRWLEREKLGHLQLQSCLQKAQDLVYPNNMGQEFFAMVLSGSQARAVGPIFAQPHGSLGRSLAKDVHLRWMTSSISCLFEYHNEAFISDVLCAFILQSNRPAGSRPLTEYKLAHDPTRLELKPVINKIVSSIWTNVVNSLGIEETSKGLLRLPKELQDVCPRGHHLESHDLGSAMNALRDCSSQVIIESEHLLTNLALWLHLHFHGRLTVVVSGATVYERILGDDDGHIELRTKRFCEKEGVCKIGKGSSTFRIYSVVGSKLDAHLMSGPYDTQQTLDSVSRVRQPLYKSPMTYMNCTASHSLKLRTRSVAKKILTWLLELKIEKNDVDNVLAFKVRHEALSQPDALTVADVVARVPQIRNFEWDVADDAASVIFMRPKAPTVDDLIDLDSPGDVTSHSSEESDEDGEQSDVSRKLLKYFPILVDLLQKVRLNCHCHICKVPGSNRFIGGCLRSQVLHEVLYYVAHGVADAFGAPDASARSASEVEADDLGVSRILLDAVEIGGESINWVSWLNTASRVVLGSGDIDKLGDTMTKDYIEKTHFAQVDRLEGQTVAVQFGSLSVIAPWLDLANPMSIKGCFGIKVIKGRIGVIAKGLNGDGEFQPVDSEEAVVQTWRTEETTGFVERFPKPEEPPDSEVTIPTDHSEVNSDCILIAEGPRAYKLLMRVCSGTHSRLIDPTLAIVKLSQQVPTISCRHEKEPILQSPSRPRILKTYPFDDLLGRWPASEDREPDGKEGDHIPSEGEILREAKWNELGMELPTAEQIRKYSAHFSKKEEDQPLCYHFSFGLDTYFKYHVALVLSVDSPTLTNHGWGCLDCCLRRAEDMDILHEIEQSDRWIINRTASALALRPKEPSSQQYGLNANAARSMKRLRIRDDKKRKT